MPQASAQEMNSAPVVSSLAGTLPIARLPSPAISAATSGRKTSAWIIGRSALHHVDIFNRDGPTVAEIGDKDCKADGGIARRHRQHATREHMAHETPKQRKSVVKGKSVQGGVELGG